MRNVLLCLAALLLCSCDQMDLCWDHPPHAPGYGINIQASWDLDWQYSYPEGTDWLNHWPEQDFGCAYDDLRPVAPEGIRVMVYPEGGSFERDNIATDGGFVSLKEGSNSILLYNNDTEYIIFNDIGSSASASATTRARTRASYTGSPYTRAEEEITVTYPDYLFGHYIPEYVATKNEVPPTVPVTMQPLVCSYLIRFHFDKGFEHVVLARGALAGLAGSVFLTDGHTEDDIVTVLFDIDYNPQSGGGEQRSASIDPTASENCLSVVVNSFGAPNFPNPYYNSRESDDLYGLNLELMLSNGNVVKFDFDVSQQLRRQPRGGVIEVGGIEIECDDGDDSSGFDINVSSWEEYEEVGVEFSEDNEAND